MNETESKKHVSPNKQHICDKLEWLVGIFLRIAHKQLGAYAVHEMRNGNSTKHLLRDNYAL